MKIYDCFTFYNELDLLDIRLAELNNSVDYFVIVEATTTFQNQPKPLYLKDNWNRYSAYHNKIIHVVVDDMPMSSDPWANERFQRNAIKRGLVNARDNDFAIVGDVDELLRPSVIESLRDSESSVVGFRMPYFNFKFNYMLVNDVETYCIWSLATRVGILGEVEELRRSRWTLNQLAYAHKQDGIEIVEHAGWHFTYLGTDDFIRQKICSFAHAELNNATTLDKIDVNSSIARGVGFNPNDPRKFMPVALDNYFPESIVSNKDKYREYIIPGTQPAKEFLP